MSIMRISGFQAKSDTVAELREFLISITSGIKSSQGCESVQLCQSHDVPTQFTMIEVWDSIEAHQASVKNISSEELAKIRPMLACTPSGSYYELLSQK